MPQKPTAIAAQRRGPTFSPRSGIESRQIHSGAENMIAAVMVSGRKQSAAKLRMRAAEEREAADRDGAEVARCASSRSAPARPTAQTMARWTA